VRDHDPELLGLGHWVHAAIHPTFRWLRLLHRLQMTPREQRLSEHPTQSNNPEAQGNLLPTPGQT